MKIYFRITSSQFCRSGIYETKTISAQQHRIVSSIKAFKGLMTLGTKKEVSISIFEVREPSCDIQLFFANIEYKCCSIIWNSSTYIPDMKPMTALKDLFFHCY
jgi:hypothetical protein